MWWQIRPVGFQVYIKRRKQLCGLGSPQTDLNKKGMEMRIIRNQTFWVGFVAGVLVWNLVLPRVAPQLKAKLPLG
jgi:hypothetical protein